MATQTRKKKHVYPTDECLAKLKADGLTQSEVSRFLCIPYQALFMHTSERGFKFARRRPTEYRRSELRRAGYTEEEVARMVPCKKDKPLPIVGFVKKKPAVTDETIKIDYSEIISKAKSGNPMLTGAWKKNSLDKTLCS